MNLNPEVEGTLIRVPIPKLTREHREMLVKLAKQNTNKAKENLRKVCTNAMNKLKKSKDKTSEDTIRLMEKQISQIADDTVAELDQHLAARPKNSLDESQQSQPDTESCVCSCRGWQARVCTALTMHSRLTLLCLHQPFSLLLQCSDLWNLFLVSVHRLVLL